jgi:ribosomal protein S18 acetylase RimI-like enzyme
MTMAEESQVSIADLLPEDRPRAIPIVIDSFEGIYRWHAKRTLREVSRVRGATSQGELVGVTMLELLEPEVGYVYYVAVLQSHRRRGVAGRLLVDALELFRRQGSRVVYAAAEEENTASIRLFVGHGFRRTERKELSWREGGLGAWGLRSRMMVVSGEELYGLRLAPEPTAPPAWS